jgi:mannose-6-phosphate isomerase-like protein (cupin superfamily)
MRDEGFLPLMGLRAALDPDQVEQLKICFYSRRLKEIGCRRKFAVGKSIFILDGPSPHVFNRGTGSVVVTDLWETHGTPADNRGNEDSISGPFRLQPPKNGSVVRIIEYPPDKQRVPALAHERNASADGSGRYEALDRGNPRHPGFHKTSSIDYAIVLSGEIVAMMDEGEALLKAGDVLIQRGTNHAWSNRTDEPAYLAFVLIDAEIVGKSE